MIFFKQKIVNMNTKKKYRRLRFLIHKYDMWYRFADLNFLDQQISIYANNLDDKKCKEYYNAYTEIKNLISELNISKEEYCKIATEEYENVSYTHKQLRVNNLKETRDNKGVYVGSCGSNIKKIRYPKKNRSRQTWKIFYNMFPELAKLDGWDGKKSKKMK